MDACEFEKLRVIIDSIGDERDVIAAAQMNVKCVANKVPYIIEGSTPEAIRPTQFGSPSQEVISTYDLGPIQEVSSGF